MHALDAEQDVMNLLINTPVPTARHRPAWVDHRAHWTEVGELRSRYVPRSRRPKQSPWVPIALALSAVLTTVAASTATVVAVLVVAFVL